jgi:agmatinase
MFIVKVPGINGEKSKGCERSGEAIIRELRNISMNEQGKLVNVDLMDLEEIHLDNSDLKLTNKLIYENSLETFGTKPRTIFLGGDGSISFSLGKAFFDYCKHEGKEPCLIIFDAHPDCKESKKENFPTSEGWLRFLIETGFPPRNILLVGVRNFSLEEMAFVKEKKIQIISADQLTEDLHETCDTLMEFSSDKNLYVSVDMDVIDPAFAPSVAYPESCGLTSRDFLYIIKRINRMKNLRLIDIVGINETKDMELGKITLKLGAKIVSELV